MSQKGLSGEGEGGNRENLHLHLHRLTDALIQSGLNSCFVAIQKGHGLRVKLIKKNLEELIRNYIQQYMIKGTYESILYMYMYSYTNTYIVIITGSIT